MKILHTSDWHLGRTLFGKKRYREFDLFLEWLLETVRQEHIEVLIVAGDIFDTTTPSNRAQEQYYRFLLDARDGGCRHIVIVAGNHDSPTFLDAPKSLLHTMRVHVVGTVPANIGDQVLVLQGADNTPQLVVCAVPYLRDRDLRRAAPGETEADRLRKVAEGIAEHYNEVLQAALNKVGGVSTMPIVATGHLFTCGAKTVDGDGVRELYVGTLAHLDVATLPSRFDYVALGHLHVPQKVGGRTDIRYAGSPIPMGFGEATQQKEVVLVDWNDGEMSVTPIVVPCFQRLVRIEGDMDKIESRVLQLVEENDSMWLEIEYTGDALMPDLKDRIATLTEKSDLEVLRIRNQRVFNQVLQAIEAQEALSELDTTEVFRRLLASADVPAEQHDELLACHGEILQRVLESDRKEA